MRVLIVVSAMLGCVTLGVWPPAAEASTPPGWSIQPTPNPPGATDSVLSRVSCWSQTSCTAVGHFTDRAGAGLPLAERWDGGRWTLEPVPRGPGGKASLLFGVSCVARSACTAVGSVTRRSGVTVPLVARRRGARWVLQRTLPLPVTGGRVSYLGDVSCAGPRFCIAVGYSGNGAGTAGVPLAERWNGTRWTVQSAGRPARAPVAFLSGVSCPSSTSCTAVGFAVNRSGIGTPLAERWNGVRWTIQRTPSPDASVLFKLVGVSCTRQGPCMAAGFFSIVTGIEVMLAERWNGGRWAISWPRYPAGATGVQFAGVSCASPSACTAVGFFGDAAGFDQVLAERWDGMSWVIEPMPSPPGALSGSTTGVSCTSATTCTAVGSYITGAGGEVTLAERYS